MTDGVVLDQTLKNVHLDLLSTISEKVWFYVEIYFE